MSALEIGVGTLTVTMGGGCEKLDFAKMSISGSHNGVYDNNGVLAGGGFPELNICVCGDIEEGKDLDTVVFRITSFSDIDALRRFCEMTLDHFKQGVLS